MNPHKSRGVGSNGTENRHKPRAPQKTTGGSKAFSSRGDANHGAKAKRSASMFCDGETGRSPAPGLMSHNSRFLRHASGLPLSRIFVPLLPVPPHRTGEIDSNRSGNEDYVGQVKHGKANSEHQQTGGTAFAKKKNQREPGQRNNNH
jgi:hypothetical protein